MSKSEEMERVTFYEDEDRNWVACLSFYNNDQFHNMTMMKPAGIYLTPDEFDELRRHNVLRPFTPLRALDVSFSTFSRAMKNMLGYDKFYDAVNLTMVEHIAEASKLNSPSDIDNEALFGFYQQLTATLEAISPVAPRQWKGVERITALFVCIAVGRYEFIEDDAAHIISALDAIGMEAVMTFAGSGIAPEFFIELHQNGIDNELARSIA